VRLLRERSNASAAKAVNARLWNKAPHRRLIRQGKRQAQRRREALLQLSETTVRISPAFSRERPTFQSAAFFQTQASRQTRIKKRTTECPSITASRSIRFTRSLDGQPAALTLREPNWPFPEALEQLLAGLIEAYNSKPNKAWGYFHTQAESGGPTRFSGLAAAV